MIKHFTLSTDNAPPVRTDYSIKVNNPTNEYEGEYDIYVSEDNWVYAPDGGYCRIVDDNTSSPSIISSLYIKDGYIKIPDLSDCKNLKDIRLLSGSDADYSMLLSAPALEKICVVSGILSDKQRAEFVMRGIKIDEVGELLLEKLN